MISTYKTIDKQLSLMDDFCDGCWINVVDPTEQEIHFISEQLKIDRNDILDVLDADEPSRLDIDENYTLLIIDLPLIIKKNKADVYKTIPIAIFSLPKMILTVCLKNNDIFKSFLENRVKNADTSNQVNFILQILSKATSFYLQYLRLIDRQSDMIEEQIHNTSKNKELINLFYLEKSLIYFSTSLSSNQIVFDKMHRFEDIKISPADMEFLEDIINENKQAIEMTNTYSEILGGIMDFFASMVSNNLNVIMKFLTSITLVFYIPTILSSLYGMNVKLPFMDNPNAFTLIIALSLTLSLIVAYVMRKKDLL